MFDIGGPELILIVLAIIILFGPKKLPEMLQMFKKGMSHVRKAQVQIKSQMDDITSDIKSTADIDIMKEIKEIKEINRDNINFETKKEHINEILDEEDKAFQKKQTDAQYRNAELKLEKEEEFTDKPEIEIKKPAQKTIERQPEKPEPKDSEEPAEES